VIAGDGGVATSVAGGATELRSGLLASKEIADQMHIFDKALHTDGGAPLLAGDVQVWERPAAAFDASERRPVIRVKGDQLSRLVALDRADLPLADQSGTVHTFELPRGTVRGFEFGVTGRHASSNFWITLASSPETCPAAQPPAKKLDRTY